MHSLKYYLFKYKYRKKNTNNSSWPINVFDLNQVVIGNKTWGGIKLLNYDRFHKSKVYIGAYCSIAAGVEFMLGGNHRTDRLSTFLFKQSGLINDNDNIENIVDKGDIIVGDDVWIGYQSLILPGANIGRGAIIGARSVVAGDVPPYSIYIGNKTIKSRFDQRIVDKLIELDYDKFDKLIVEKPQIMEKLLYNNVSDDLIDELFKLVND